MTFQSAKRSSVKPALLLLAGFFIFGCASKRVVYHPSRQQQQRPAQNQTGTTTTGTTSGQTAGATGSQTGSASSQGNTSGASTTTPSLPVTQNPAPMLPPLNTTRPTETTNNLTELRKNLPNKKIAEDLIENKLSEEELAIAAATPSFDSVKPQVLLKLGKLNHKNRNSTKAAEYYRAVSSLYPNTPQGTQATALLGSIQASYSVDARVIGAVLPLTGRMSSIGQHALNAIRMGLELNKPEAKYRLALFDSQSNAEMAAKGVDKLIKEDKAIAILGGFTATEATAIGHQAELFNVPFIAFSQKTGLTNIGDYVFRNALTPEMQVDKLTQFAFEKLGARKFAIVFPNDSYGVEFSNIFWDHVLARGGEVTAAQTYDPKETDFSEVAQKLLGTYHIEARAEEYKQRLAQQKARKKKQKSTRDHWADDNILPPIVDFDVVFVPDSSRALGQILAFMKYYDVRQMNYIGTNIWNSPDLPKRVADENADLYFVEALDVSQGSTQHESPFIKDYSAQFSESPTIVEIQAYEAASILKSQLDSGVSSRENLASRLRYLGRSNGVTGELRMSNQRELQRPLHILSLDAGIIKKVE